MNDQRREIALEDHEDLLSGSIISSFILHLPDEYKNCIPYLADETYTIGHKPKLFYYFNTAFEGSKQDQVS